MFSVTIYILRAIGNFFALKTVPKAQGKLVCYGNECGTLCTGYERGSGFQRAID